MALLRHRVWRDSFVAQAEDKWLVSVASRGNLPFPGRGKFQVLTLQCFGLYFI